MKVTNINGTSDNTCRCASWLDHWVKFNPERQSVPATCPVLLCLRTPTVGAHVQKSGFLDSSWYIVPLCAEHNGKLGSSLDVSDSTSLASANVGATCGKK